MSPLREDVAYTLIDILAKIACTMAMMHGSMHTHEQRKAQCVKLENWRISEQLRAESM